MEKLRYRMYGLVPYNLSPIQQGIQFGHAVVEFQLKYAHPQRSKNKWRTRYYDWAENDKTFIILNGGTTNETRNLAGMPKGTLNQHLDWLVDNNIPFAEFYEPDLGDQLTAVVFLVDERVWDKVNYPDFDEYLNLRSQDYDFPGITQANFDWEDRIGKKQVKLRLREWISQFKLA